MRFRRCKHTWDDWICVPGMEYWERECTKCHKMQTRDDIK